MIAVAQLTTPTMNANQIHGIDYFHFLGRSLTKGMLASRANILAVFFPTTNIP